MGIILASASPRREDLLRQVGCDFRILTSDVDEDNTLDIPPALLVEGHAKAKAESVAARVEPGDIVIGADTIVVLDGKVYGKPRDKEEAALMLAELAGREHQVITGIAVVCGGQTWTENTVTTVRIRSLSDEEIRQYVLTGEPLDKAGAYAIQGIGALLVEGISGCYSNVVGLPLASLDSLLRRTARRGLR